MRHIPPRRRRGYTLIELIVSMGSATMLIAGLASALFTSSSAMSLDSGSQAKRQQSAEIQADLMADLQYALNFSERTANAVTFTVPDRDGDSNPETIRYAWSGTAGDPLTYEYNNGTAVTLADDVQSFDLSYLTRTMQPDFNGPENVLFVVTSSSNPTSAEQSRKTQLESWGYTVELIGQSESQSAYDTAFASNDVVYVSMKVNSYDPATKVRNAPIGVVNGEPHYNSYIDFSSGYSYPTVSSIDIVVNSHYITSQFNAGSLSIFSSTQEAHAMTGTLAGGLQTLAEIDDSGTNRPGLAIIDAGDSLYGGGTAPARRVALPWGSRDFDFAALTSDGLTLLKRSLDWAGEQTPTAPGSGPVFEEFTETIFGSNSNENRVVTPPGTVQGDLLIAAIATDGNTVSTMATPFPAAGWNLIGIDERFDTVTFAVWWKIAGSSEPSRYGFTWSGDNEQSYAWIMRFTGHDPTNPINASALVTQGSDAGDPPSPEVTTTVDNALILRLGGFDDDDIVTDSPGLSGHTAITMKESNSGSGTTSGGAGYVIQPTAGASGTSTFSLTDQEQSVSITIAIAPAP